MHVHTNYDEKGDKVCDDDVRVEPVAMYVSNGEHAEDVTLIFINVVEVVGNIDGHQDSAC